MKFDSNRAWKRATSAISANREVVYALAGVFFLVPGLAMALLFPAPEPTAGLDRDAAMALVSDYYVSILPYLIPMVIFQAAGTLALLTLLTDRGRPTVGEAISMGLKGIIPYVLAQLALGLGIGLVCGALFALTTLAGVPAIGLIAAALVFVYAWIKTSLVAPIIAVEGERNPIAALRRSWRLTSSNSARIALFYLLVIIAFSIVILAVTAIVGIVLALFADAYAVGLAGAVITSAFNAVMALYFVAIVAATHHQLAGHSPETVSATFD
ncbi:MAG: glycerophosphoryl diester phosphodiesterase membrane domain-containing protein [Sphingomonadaceae bacterium]|nr:glycerophosphoryl diester phosphodiesterase membrane domain-containing protein [Sphingomonadaceae bacterium]